MQQVAHFEVKETIGFGALGTVYLAWDTKLNRNVALKVLSDDVKDDNLRKRFELEARTIAALKHENIVRVLDYSDATVARPFIALEHLEGNSVFDFMSKYGPLSEHVALCIGREVAAALEYAHSQNIVHRDVKPDNVVLEGERVVLIDFGAMRLTDQHAYIPTTDVDKTPMAIGTPGYMAPEQLKTTEVDHRADLFALGALLYHATTRMLPYEASAATPEEIYREAKRGNYRDPRDYQPLLTPGFCDLLADCMTPSKSARLPTATKVREAIEALLDAHGITDVKLVLRRFIESPRGDEQNDLRSVDALTRDLKLALLRDVRDACVAQDGERIRHATNRLRYVHHLFDEAEKFFLLDAVEKPRLLKGRRMSRTRWFLIGLLSATLMVTAAAAARPSVFATLGKSAKSLVARLANSSEP